MREIKFRAWDKIGKWMIDVGSIDWNNNCIIRPKPNDYPHTLDSTELMQYTGLHDKNGKEIWEGDIVAIRRENDGTWESGDCERAEIEYYGEYGAFVLTIYTVFGGEGYESLVGSEVGKYYRERIEVIGNIYENPELLETK